MRIEYRFMNALPVKKAHRSLRGATTTLDKAVRMLSLELFRIHAKTVTLEGGWSDTRRFSAAGWPTTLPDCHTHVRITVEAPKVDRVILACSVWNHVAWNIWNMAKTIEMLRGIERYGCVEMGQQWSGFKALPQAIAVREWASPEAAIAWMMGIAGVDVSTAAQVAGNPRAIDALYREAAKRAHPDVGGSDELMSKLGRAVEAAGGRER